MNRARNGRPPGGWDPRVVRSTPPHVPIPPRSPAHRWRPASLALASSVALGRRPGKTTDEIVEAYPYVTAEDIAQALCYQLTAIRRTTRDTSGSVLTRLTTP